jgi:YD repeat-containing protein
MDWRDALEKVVRWRFVSQTNWPHREEPVLHERTWAYRGHELSAQAAQAFSAARRVGYDVLGRPVIVGPGHIAPERWGVLDPAQAERDGVRADVGYEGGPTDLDTVVYANGAVEVHFAQYLTSARTTFDASWRPVETRYEGAYPGEERYRWDGAGRLVEIAESPAIMATTMSGSRPDGGGVLRIDHGAHGPVRIIDEHGYLVWERCDEPWPQLFDRAVKLIADAVITATTKACRDHGVDPATEVFALMLAYRGDTNLDCGVYLGLDTDRRAWLGSGMSGDDLSYNLWHLDVHPSTPCYEDPTAPIVARELDRLLLQEAGLNQPADAREVVLDAVGAIVSRHDWRGVMTLTEDFVVYRMGHDEGLRWANESVRAANPVERVAAWERNWPTNAPRGDDDY